ncbi:MAG: 50S ribosomal protein L5 [bacterium]
MMPRLQKKYKEEILPKLKKELNCSNDLMAPRLEKVVVNVGFGSKSKEPKYQETIENTLTRITGQKPLNTIAKKSISNFKLRKGTVVGMKATMRNKRMYDFVDKLINVSLPRVRDFRGLRTTVVDSNGNLNIGFKEHLSFPEISSDEVEQIHGLEITLVSTAKDKNDGYLLFEMLGFPFNKELKKEKKAKSKSFNNFKNKKPNETNEVKS